ncbi:MAG: hypothetical protein V7L25_04410 [Nostoc sp.]
METLTSEKYKNRFIEYLEKTDKDNLKPADIEKIYHARDILIYRVDNPP